MIHDATEQEVKFYKITLSYKNAYQIEFANPQKSANAAPLQD
jgi:hypothetical protein